MNAPTITISSAHLSFKQKTLFKGLDLTLQAGKLTCLLGASGVGKTSLLRLIAQLATPNISLKAHVSSDQKGELSQQISYMAQTDLLLPWLSVLENVLIGYKLRSISPPYEKAKELLTLIGLGSALKLYPRELSGGMRQRAALVRTLLEDKNVILMDEPFSSLDAITRYRLQTLTAELLHKRTVFLVTHDPLEALRIADEIYIMSGCPAYLHSPLKLQSKPPRDLSSKEVIELQPLLFAELLKANEASQ